MNTLETVCGILDSTGLSSDDFRGFMTDRTVNRTSVNLYFYCITAGNTELSDCLIDDGSDQEWLDYLHHVATKLKEIQDEES